MKSHFPILTILVLAASGLLAETYHETAIPKTLTEWKDSQDGKVSVCFTVNKTTFGAKEAITVRCAIRNLSDKPITILRPFGDPFYVSSSGLTILGPDGAIPYQGDMKEYVRGTNMFLELPAHKVLDETFELPLDIFPGLGKPGLYRISYQCLSDGYPKNPPPENFWRGQIKAATLTILIK